MTTTEKPKVKIESPLSQLTEQLFEIAESKTDEVETTEISGLKTPIKKLEVDASQKAVTKVSSLKTEIKPKEPEYPIGSLWAKVSPSGVEYFTGEIELNGVLTYIKLFRNRFKELDKHPDWKIFERKFLPKNGN